MNHHGANTMPKLFTLTAALLTCAIVYPMPQSAAAQTPTTVVNLIELEIDPVQLDAYKAALKEEIETSIRVEPGVLTLYAVSLKDQPTEIRLFETYTNPAAYQAHLNSPQYKKYKAATQGMVKSRKLLETAPILLGGKHPPTP
jgi:quinol monooxygenase YgiN